MKLTQKPILHLNRMKSKFQWDSTKISRMMACSIHCICETLMNKHEALGWQWIYKVVLMKHCESNLIQIRSYHIKGKGVVVIVKEIISNKMLQTY